ncbi:type III pantothenate kinase [Candidatus Electronema sp. PJ]|uniref:type III pantothenate kinase n=1 Tax=Candidatus Electronema sp. PJ TaxID=3401572 RepID=UPI003AA943CB
MLIAVDVGNSHTVIGIFYNQALVHQWRLKTDRRTTADELILACHTLFALDDLSKDDLTGFVVCSVVPALEAVWLKFAERYFTGLVSPPLAVSHQIDTGLRILTPSPGELGADRLVNAAAAWEACGTALIVIDFGTAITFDCVSDKGEYLGGTIHPGIGISLEALAERTAKLPRVDLNEKPAAVIGTTTIDAIRSGMLYGFGGLIDRMVERLSQAMQEQGAAAADSKISVIATGGMAELISPYSSVLEYVDSILTLTGLRILHERNCIEGSA